MSTMSSATVAVINDKAVEIGQGDAVAPLPQPSPKKGWIKFEEDTSKPAVISTESIQVNLERSSMTQSNSTVESKALRNVELPAAAADPIQQGFCMYLYHFREYNILSFNENWFS